VHASESVGEREERGDFGTRQPGLLRVRGGDFRFTCKDLDDGTISRGSRTFRRPERNRDARWDRVDAKAVVQQCRPRRLQEMYNQAFQGGRWVATGSLPETARSASYQA
jgi:hypothetical protein